MTKSEYLNLNIPARPDNYYLADWNENLAIIEEELLRQKNVDSTLTSNMTYALETIGTYNDSIEDAVAQAKKAYDQAIVAQTSVAALKEDVEAIDARLEKAEKKIVSLQSQADTNTASISKIINSFQALKVELQEYEDKLEQLAEELSDYSSYIICTSLPDLDMANYHAVYVLRSDEDVDIYVIRQNASGKYEWLQISSSSYNWLTNKPLVNAVELQGDKSFEDLGLYLITDSYIDSLF